ncbi:hypothetical protein H1164_08495 [Thermoactinomyces daqus]|uniref:Uncharacterized protein n=1 Tax=Thermoactinomyces daqus TaxID=1329516 RepID=A0A7W2AI59_9BACL|nr:hypothetical protein [Thermoactinomyces daqus]MBA4542940.1 hypothetical protein [Thermoactinomyces daqus]
MKNALIVMFVLLLSVFIVNAEDGQTILTQDHYAFESAQMGEPWCC